MNLLSMRVVGVVVPSRLVEVSPMTTMIFAPPGNDFSEMSIRETAPFCFSTRDTRNGEPSINRALRYPRCEAFSACCGANSP